MKRGIIFSAWDLLHPGHLYTLKKCKEKCDWLIVGLQVDPSQERPEKNKPVETIFERYLRLRSCKFVDEIVPYENNKDMINMFCVYDIDIRFLGEDYKDHPEKIVGKDIVPIEFIPRKHAFSTTELRGRL
jgi:glycerol-3-phosphate cytidylyltransferase